MIPGENPSDRLLWVGAEGRQEAMILHEVELKDVGWLRPAVVRFSDLPQGLIAICGPNGSGKTLLLESTGPAPLFREFASRLPLKPEKILGTTGQIRLVFEIERVEYVVTMKMSGGTLRSHLSGGAETTGKRADFVTTIEELVCPKSVFYASQFGSAYDAGSMIGLKSTARKALFRSLLGIEEMEALSGRARKAADEYGDVERLYAEAVQASKSASSELTKANFAIRALVEKRLPAAERAYQDAEQVHSRARAAISEDYGRHKQALSAAKAEQAALLEERADLCRAIEDAEDRIKDVESTKGRLNILLATLPGLQERAGVETRIVEEKRIAEDDLRHSEELVDTLSSAIVEAEGVPCGAKGKFVACPHLRALPARRKRLSSALATHARAETCIRGVENSLKTYAGSVSAFSDASREVDELQTWLAKAERWIVRVAEWKKRLVAIEPKVRQLNEIVFKETSAVHESGGDDAERNVLRSQTRLREAHQALQETSEELGRLRERAASLRERRQAARATIDDSADNARQVRVLRFVQQMFGKNGIQALETAAACPAVADIASSLLADVGIETSMPTLRKTADGREVDDFDVSVSHSSRGVEGSVELLSQGERMVVDHALRFAISIYKAQQHRRPIRTFWQDEKTSALDPEFDALYLSMLQKTAERIGVHHVLHVTHDQRIIDNSVARLVLDKKGNIHVER